MTRRCKHEFVTKEHYPDEMMCMKCGDWWNVDQCMYMNPKQLITLPLSVRFEVMKRQANIFNNENPDYYLNIDEVWSEIES